MKTTTLNAIRIGSIVLSAVAVANFAQAASAEEQVKMNRGEFEELAVRNPNIANTRQLPVTTLVGNYVVDTSHSTPNCVSGSSSLRLVKIRGDEKEIGVTDANEKDEINNINAVFGGINAPAQHTGDSTGVSDAGPWSDFDRTSWNGHRLARNYRKFEAVLFLIPVYDGQSDSLTLNGDGSVTFRKKGQDTYGGPYSCRLVRSSVKKK